MGSVQRSERLPQPVAIVAPQTCAYTAVMFASLVAALACAAPLAGTSVVDVHAMSLPPEAAMSSPAANDLAAGDRVLASFADDLESRSLLIDADERQLFTALEVDCHRTAAPLVDWSALVSRADSDTACRQFATSRSGYIAALAHSRTRGAAHRVEGGRIAAAAPSFVPDGHATPPLWPARIALVHSFDGALACAPSAATPPAPPGRRIDRPPRS
jgi:hypothetical protein